MYPYIIFLYFILILIVNIDIVLYLSNVLSMSFLNWMEHPSMKVWMSQVKVLTQTQV